MIEVRYDASSRDWNWTCGNRLGFHYPDSFTALCYAWHALGYNVPALVYPRAPA